MTTPRRVPSPLVLDVARYIESHYANHALPRAVLLRANCSPRHLARVFRTEMGMTIGRYLATIRLYRAAALIEQGEKVEAVSRLVGYRSTATLFRHFQRFLGVTPRQFAGRADDNAEEGASLAARVRTFLEAHYAERLTLDRVAAWAGASKRQLTTLFESEHGRTVHAYLTDVRIRHAAALVLSGEKIEVVSLRVGYRSKKNFYRAFKARLGMAPRKYRARQQRAVSVQVVT